MPSSGRTDFLNLPQWLVTDHPHMPDDINAPFASLDAYAAGRRLQTYTSLDQIGLSGLATTAQVCAAMPAYSKLVLRQVLTDATRITDVPYDWVMVTITRPGLASNCKCVADSLDGADQWSASYSQDNVPALSGWVKAVGTAPMVSGSDADDYTDSGDYYCSSNEVAEKIDNMPAAAAGLLEVRDLGGTIFQRYTLYTGNVIYMRYKPNWGSYEWGYWRKVYRDEIGTWTPRFEYAYNDSLSTCTYASRSGFYYRNGALVVCIATIKMSSKGNLGTDMCVKGFPFPRNPSVSGYSGGYVVYHNLEVGTINLEMTGSSTVPYSWLYSTGTGRSVGVSGGNMTDTSVFEGMTWIYFTNS